MPDSLSGTPVKYRHPSTDLYSMSTETLRRFPPAPPAYTFVSWTQHWRILDGIYYRDANVRTADGARAVYALREDAAAVAA
jgi:hypothetical protein